MVAFLPTADDFNMTFPAWFRSLLRSNNRDRRRVRSPTGFGAVQSLERRLVLATFTVTSTSDTIDGDDGVVTLREAITEANATAGTDQIHFNIPGNGVHRILPNSALPTITEAVVLDGTTSPNYAGTPVVELRGTNAGASVSGLTIAGNDSIIRGLVINGFENGVLIDGGSHNHVEASFIGTDATGLAALPNSNDGVHLRNGASQNIIGGPSAEFQNVISGNAGDGVEIRQATSILNQVIGNLIGVGPDGITAVPNQDGVEIDDGASLNMIGGSTATLRNVISGNSSDGVEIWDTGSTGNSIEGNYIGTDITGSMAVANGLAGIRIGLGASDNRIGGAVTGAGNLLSGNGEFGVRLQSTGSNNNEVSGNFIGTDKNGTAAVPNGIDGVILVFGASNNVIGGPTEDHRNLISGNAGDGVEVHSTTSVGNRIEGNWIGTDITGTAPLPNGSDGVELESAVGNFIGGVSPGAGNVIAFNTHDGVMAINADTANNSILRNSIHSNGQRGIDLGNDGVTLNDFRDEDVGPNNLTNFPRMRSAIPDATSTTIVASMSGMANTVYSLDFYSNDLPDPTSYGEGRTYLGTASGTSDEFGTGDVSVTVPFVLTPGTIVTSTATDPAGNTSEFSPGVRVGATGGNVSIFDAYLVDGRGDRISQPVTGERVTVEVVFDTDHLSPANSYDVQVAVDGIELSSHHTEGAGISFGRWTTSFRGWYAAADSRTVQITVDPANTVPEVDETDNSTSFSFTSQSANDLPAKFLSPVTGVPFQDWRVSGYVDLDPLFDGNRLDYGGSAYTYDTTNYNHDALDLGPGNFAKMDEGIPILAVADGIISFARDGHFDRHKEWLTPAATSNSVTIDHGNGWTTHYVHLRRDSVAVSEGDSVSAGDFLGFMGSSGNSTGTHLHFGVRHNNAPVETYLDPDTFWVNPWPYAGDSPGVLDSGMTNVVPEFSEYREGITRMTQFQPGNRVTFWAYVNGQNDGDTREYRWYRPDGSLYHSETFTQTGLARSGIKWYNVTIPSTNSLGTWAATFVQNGIELAREEFEITNTSVPEIRVEEGTDFILDGRFTPLEFGPVPRGNSAPTKSLTVTNQGNGPLTITGVDVPEGFTVVDELPGTLAAGASDTLTVRLNTGTAGFFAGQIRIHNNDTDEGVFEISVEGSVTDPLLDELVLGISERKTIEGNDVVASLRRSGDTSTDLTVNLGSSLSAIAGVPTFVTFPAGETRSIFDIVIPLDLSQDSDHLVTISASASGFGNAQNVLEVLNDATPPGFTVTPTSGLTTTESGEAATFTVALNSQPDANVTIQFSSSDTTEGTVTPASVTFTTSDWDTPQTVTVTGVDDSIEDGPQNFSIVTTAVATGNYQGIDPSDVSVTNQDDDGHSLDIDGNVAADAATDGILILRYLFGFRGTALTNNAVGSGANNATPAEIESALNNSASILDADGNGLADAATDGILILRYLFGFRGTALTNSAVGSGATRTTGTAIAAYLDGFLPPPSVTLQPSFVASVANWTVASLVHRADLFPELPASVEQISAVDDQQNAAHQTPEIGSAHREWIKKTTV